MFLHGCGSFATPKMSQATPSRREMDSIDQLFESLMDQTNAEVNELIKEVATENTEVKKEEEAEEGPITDLDNVEESDPSENPPAPQEPETQEVEAEIEIEIEQNISNDGDAQEIEGTERETDQLLQDELDLNEEEASIDQEEPPPVERPDDIDQQIRRLRFRDEAAPMTHFNSRGTRRYKKLINSMKGPNEGILVEYARVDLPAHKAAWEGNVEALEQVYSWKHKEGVPCIDRRGATPLHLAARRNHLNVIRWLMKYSDLSVMQQAANAETPVHVAAALGHADCVKAMVASEERDVKYILSYLQDRLGFTCLLLAIHKHQNAAAKILIEELGIRSVSAINDTGINSAHVASAAGNVEVLKMLHSKHKKLLHGRAADGTTPVYFAAQEGRLQALQFLYDTANCDLLKASEDGLKPIHAACQTGHTSIVKFIVSRLGPQAMKNRIVDGATPLHFASAAGKIKTVLWLIKNDSSGELLNSADHHGDTPLHDAIESGHLDIVRIMVEQGADIYSANKFGKTPFSLAMESEMISMQEYIQEFVNRKAEEEEARLNEMKIFDMEGGEEVVNLEDEEESEEEQDTEYPYSDQEGPTPIPSRLFRDRRSVLAKRPSLQLWPPMPCTGDSDEEEEEERIEEERMEEERMEEERMEELQGGLENIEEEGESDEFNEDKEEDKQEDKQEEEEEGQQTPPAKVEEIIPPKIEVTEKPQEVEIEEPELVTEDLQQLVEDQEMRAKERFQEERSPERFEEPQTIEVTKDGPTEAIVPAVKAMSDVAVVQVVSEAYNEDDDDKPDDSDKTDDDDDKDDEQGTVENKEEEEIANSQVANDPVVDATDLKVETINTGNEEENKTISETRERRRSRRLKVADTPDSSVPKFPEVKLRKTNPVSKPAAAMNRRMSDPDFKGAGPELKKIFRFRKEQVLKK